jgi:hypothetical protein
MVPGLYVSRKVPLRADAGTTTVEIHNMRVRIARADKPVAERDLVIVYEPRNGLVWWAMGTGATVDYGKPMPPIESDEPNYAWRVTGKKIVRFVLTTPRLRIDYRESIAGRYSSYARAQRAVLTEVARDAARFLASNWLQFKEIVLVHRVDIDFGVLKHADSSPGPTLRSIDHAGDHWTAVIDGENGDMVRVVFRDDDYSIVSVTQGPR